MSYKTKVLGSLNITKDAQNNATTDASDLADLMANPEYLRYSSAIINDALKEGFDVLQLPNGDIVTTGTKIITNTFMWDAKKNAMTKARAGGSTKRGRKAKPRADDKGDEA